MQETLLPLRQYLWQETLGWQPNSTQQELFNQFYQQILLGNQAFNLTRITEVSEFWEKHLWDSLRGIKPLLNSPEIPRKVMDIGTGAGVPGIPIAIAQPQAQVVLLDSTQKKLKFLDRAITDIHLPNATTLLGRAEQVNDQVNHRQKYDVVTIRAVAKVELCVKYSIPFLNPNGLAILYRGNWTEEEAGQLNNILPKYQAEVVEISSFTTPITKSVRHCIYLRRNSH
jgi:16S rRNA (guanine527-N7)-methyltransferase